MSTAAGKLLTRNGEPFYLRGVTYGTFAPDQGRQIGDWLFGCDVCQDVCPWNVTFARPTADPEFAPDAKLIAPDADAFDEVEPAEFARRWGDTPFARPGLTGMRRNAAAVRANRTAV